MKNDRWMPKKRNRVGVRLQKIMNCLRSGEQLRTGEMVASSESLATKDYAASWHASHAGDIELMADTGNIEEAESSLRDRGSLNYEEARALLGRYEYQKGNIEASLHVFEGIDIAAITPKMKITLAKRGEPRKRRSQDYSAAPMSIHAVALLLEAIYLKSKSLQSLGRYKEAAQSCTIILDILESSLPAGLPENFGDDCKLQETLNKAVELLPELWKLAEFPREATLSYRRTLLHQWNLEPQSMARIQKEFGIFLLYSGSDVNPPTLLSQLESSYVPKNNIEEAILIFMLLLKNVSLRKIDWDPSILDHLTYALSISGGLRALARQVEGLFPDAIDRREMYYTLALCYHGEGDDSAALNLLRKLLHDSEDPVYIPGLLLASKICGESSEDMEDGSVFARRAIKTLGGTHDKVIGVANCMLGVSLSAHARSVVMESERVKLQAEALQALEFAGRITKLTDSYTLYHLCLENAEQRRLDDALYYAKCLLKLDARSNLKGWILLARILSAQKQFLEAEIILNAALEHTGKWDQGELLRTKAKVQVAQDQLKNALETYTHLLAILQLQSKSAQFGGKLVNRSLELETWHDVASIYIKLSQWHDAEQCLSRSKAITHVSASRCYITGTLHEHKGNNKEALKNYVDALMIDPGHVPSLVASAMILRRVGSKSSVVRSFLMEALRLDRMNASGWYNLGLLYKDEGTVASALEAVDCFQAAEFLESSQPIEPFR